MEEEEVSDDSDLESKEEDDVDPYQKLVVPSTVPENIVKLKISFGYDCKRLFNLCLVDPDTLLFASGNLLHYYCISKNIFKLRRTVFGGGVGFILKNHIPKYGYLTIAENGKDPTVFIYKYPEHNIISELKGGAVKSFTTGVYSNNGELMGTQAGSPDFMLTIWNWQTSSIILRSRAYQNDVLDLTFSIYNPILLATCGLSHVQFWKMAETFTGLKLKSDLGRFGKTDTSDVYAVFMLADEKVISGCEWGNMLVWEAGLIKLEVTRKARIPCHSEPITSFFWMGNNELMTIGMDGYARIWFWETVELSDPPEDDRFVEIDPIYEFRIGDKDETCESRHLIKAKAQDDNDFVYYAQDGKGGVWVCDLNTVTTPKPAKKLFSCHGGRIMSGQASPNSNHIATLGEDGKVNIYNYITGKLLIQEPFNSPGRALIWLDTSIDPSGMVLILGFEDGVVRQVAFKIDESKKPSVTFNLLYVIKPHAEPVNCLGIAPSKNILVSGAMDRTLFMFHIKNNGSDYAEIVALGFFLFTGSPRCLHWDTTKDKTVLIGCHTGEVYEIELPVPESIDLVKVRPTWRIYPLSIKMYKFKSVKSRIRRDLEIAATMKRKAKKLRAKKREMKRLMEINPGLQFDESALADSSEDDEEEKPLYIPDPPNPVLWLQYTDKKTIWLSMGGYDAGYVYEVKFGQEEPVSCTLIPEGDDIEINSYIYIGQYLIFAMQTGQIRVNAVKQDFRELNDFWIISMHDNLNGVIPAMFTSYDGKWFFSIGYDGNLFYYRWKGQFLEKVFDPPILVEQPSIMVKDIEDPKYLSLEQMKNEENLVKLRAFEEAERKRLQPSLEVLQMQVDWTVDKVKPEFQADLNAVIAKLKVDVTGAEQDAQDLYDRMFIPLEYIPFEVFGIESNVIVRAFRLLKLVMEADAELEEMGEEEIEEEQSTASDMIAFESVTTVAGNRSTSAMALKIFDFAEKVLLNFYVRLLDFFTMLQQIKSEEVDRVRELCGDTLEMEIEEEYTVEGTEDDDGEEEELGEEEEEELSIVEKAIRFLNNSIRQTVEVKILEINIIKQILYALKSEFNKKVLDCKIRKAKLYQKYEKLRLEILEDTERDNRPPLNLPPLRELVIYNEYPDEIFKEPFIPLRSFESILWEKPMKKTAAQMVIEEHPDEDIKEDELTSEDYSGEGEEEYAVGVIVSEEWGLETENLEMKIYNRIFGIDKDLETALSVRPNYEIEIKYLTISQEIAEKELIILKECEQTERFLSDRDEAAKARRNAITNNIKRLRNEIDMTIKSFDGMNNSIKQTQVEFYEAVKGNKFFKFLRRIFEKKFKPAKEVASDDESESESSSSESSSDEEEDAGSGESGDMTAIQLDESHCPSGCDRKLYDMSFELRTTRHNFEQMIYDGMRANDVRRAKIDEFNNKIPAADDLCEKEHANLLIFRHQKDEKIRAVETSIIYSIEGFGLEIKQHEPDQTDQQMEEYMKYLDELLTVKKDQYLSLRVELQRLTEIYTEKVRILLEILEERERLRRKKPPPPPPPPPPKSISIVSIVRPPTPPPPFDFEAYAAEKILKLVQRFFAKYLAKYIPEPYMRKYIPKVARCLGNIGRNFTCELADNIIGVIVENLQRIVPKKYLIHATLDDIRGLFKDVVNVFIQEPVEIKPLSVIAEVVEKCMTLYSKPKAPNKTQRIILEVSKLLVQELPMDDFRNADNVRYLAKLLAREPVIIPICLDVQLLIEQVTVFAKKNMLSAVTVKIVRAYAEVLQTELVTRKAAEVRLVKPKERICRDVMRKKRMY